MSNNDLPIIKERIYEEGLIEEILTELDCDYIKRVGNRWECQLPDRFGSNNRRSVQIKETPSLSSSIRSRGVSGDIYIVIGYILYEVTEFEELKDYIHQIKVWLCNLFNWNEYLEMRDDFEEEKKDYLSFLRPIQKKRKRRDNKNYLLGKSNEVLNKEIVFSWYENTPHVNFLDDGINVKTQRIFEVMFDMESNRVVFPIYNRHGELISMKGRYVGDSIYIQEEFKYLYMYNFDKMIELYNLHRALNYIEKTGEVIVFESEKSCMKAYQYGFKNTVAIMGSEISPVQAYLLRSLDANIIFAFDKDMSKEFIEKQARQIKTRKCFYIEDSIDSLGEKDAPVDKGEETWKKLYTQCVKVI